MQQKPKNLTYKKWWFILIFIVVVIGIVVFVGSKNKKQSTEVGETKSGRQLQTENATDKLKDKNFGINNPAELDTLRVTVLEVKKSEGENFFKPDEGNIFVGTKFEIENISDEEVSISSLMLFESYADDIKANYSIAGSTAFSDSTLDGVVLPEKKMIGWLVIETDKAVKEIEHVVTDSILGVKSVTFKLKVE